MQSTVQHSGNKNVKPNVWANSNLARTVAALDEFKYGFPSNGLKTVSNKWWGKSAKGGRRDEGGENTEEGDVKDKDEEASEKKPNSLVTIRKRIAEEGREAVEFGLRQGFGSKRLDRKDQVLLSQIFKSSLPKDWVADSS